ncbi:MAG: nicotinate phosphoribosyltransferase [Acidobacteria bacterium]|nr:MAG: nicotinate phosphoribosyltransferase [Acidobacteriota bacterium]
MNFLLRTDSYKFTHWKQYPPKTTRIYSYLESRGGMFPNTVFFGLQYYLKHYFEGPRFTPADIAHADEFCLQHFGRDLFNRQGWTRLYDKHHGLLPVRIKAVPEGTVVPLQNVLVTIENTDPEFPWLTNYLETLLLKVWYPTTVATLSREIKRIIGGFLERTGDPSLLPFKLHDFGYRGVSSEESAAIGGAAHLVNFKGTDTVAGIVLLQDYYQAKSMPGFSIPASEHSTITAWGKEHELDAYRNMLQAYPTGLVACVSDSYDIYNACEKLWGEMLKPDVVHRNGTLIIRPDSGDPVTVLTRVFDILGEKFGSETNSKGYRVLSPCVRVIHGDGVNMFTIQNMLYQLSKFYGWSADNLAFGMGGALLQQLNRDTLKFAFKCSAAEINGKWQPVYKDPVTDPGKNSKHGRMALVESEPGRFHSIENVQGAEFENQDCLVPIFENGKILLNHDLDSIRERAEVHFGVPSLSTAQVEK